MNRLWGRAPDIEEVIRFMIDSFDDCDDARRLREINSAIGSSRMLTEIDENPSLIATEASIVGLSSQTTFDSHILGVGLPHIRQGNSESTFNAFIQACSELTTLVSDTRLDSWIREITQLRDELGSIPRTFPPDPDSDVGKRLIEYMNDRSTEDRLSAMSCLVFVPIGNVYAEASRLRERVEQWQQARLRAVNAIQKHGKSLSGPTAIQVLKTLSRGAGLASNPEALRLECTKALGKMDVATTMLSETLKGICDANRGSRCLKGETRKTLEKLLRSDPVAFVDTLKGIWPQRHCLEVMRSSKIVDRAVLPALYDILEHDLRAAVPIDDLAELHLSIGPGDAATETRLKNLLVKYAPTGTAVLHGPLFDMLAAYGSSALRPLFTLALKCSADMRRCAIAAVTKRWHRAQSATMLSDTLEAALASGDVLDFETAARAAAACPEIQPKIVPALKQLLRSESSTTSAERMCRALSRVTDLRDADVPLMIKQMREERSPAKVLSIWSVLKAARITGIRRENVDGLLTRLTATRDKQEILDIAQCLSKLGVLEAKLVIPPVLEALFLGPPCKEMYLQASPLKDLRNLLTSVERSRAQRSMIDLAFTAASYGWTSVGTKGFGEVSMKASDRAISQICSVKSRVSSSVLNLICQKRDVVVSIDGCFGDRNSNHTFDFGRQRRMAMDELQRRGNPEYDPNAF